MGNIEVSPEALRAYGASAGAISTELAATGGFDLAANLAAMVPVFGLIGQDFLAAFGVAQANHAAGLTNLAGHYGNAAARAHATADSYTGADSHLASGLGTIV